MSTVATQRIIRIRREYNTWVANESLEDYALRFAPRSFRKWSTLKVAATAFGSVSFLALEAIGGAIMINYGFANALWAILGVGLIIFLTGIPICYYASRDNIDMDLLARGAGFGYIGSTITSLIYASFTFIFFALEAAIMALVFELYFGLPLAAGYLLSSIVIIPLVTHGITLISRLQSWTFVPWLVLSIVPFFFIFRDKPDLLESWTSFTGYATDGNEFEPLMFGMAATVSFSLIAQIGEQVDFLRFLPEKTRENRISWWTAMMVAGPGWVVPGVIKQLAGAFLAFVALQHLVPPERAQEPTQMYLIAWQYVFDDPRWALAAMTLFVIVSQVKINVTNAYAGSLAWSNFFSRLTHSHPGRVVWLVFNVAISILLMELGVFGALAEVLGLYSCIAIAWVGALVADLVINKPVGLSPPYIEFRRAYLHDVNPVGVGATLIATVLSMTAFVGVFGETAQAFSPFIALVAAMITAPAIAWWTDGRYYLARQRPEPGTLSSECCVCGNSFEAEDMAACPAYAGTICSLCCTLDARCRDMCKAASSSDPPSATLIGDWLPAYRRLSPQLRTRLTQFLMTYGFLFGVVTALVWLIYYQETLLNPTLVGSAREALQTLFMKVWGALAVVVGVAAWWLVLTRESRLVAEEESMRQNRLLQQEIEEHRKTDAALQRAKEIAESASRAKSRFLADMSHELRTPLNSMLGYAQILRNDPSMPGHRIDAIDTIRQGGEHLIALIDDILDIARIEAGRFRLRSADTDFADFLAQIVRMFQVAAGRKGIGFRVQLRDRIPRIVRMDQRRVRQLLLNLIGNAVKFTSRGEVVVSIGYSGEIARIRVRDTGPGIPREDIERIFQPFQRARNTPHTDDSTGLGLTVSRMITEQMGGELAVESEVGAGSTFTLRLFLPEQHGAALPARLREVIGYRGNKRQLLVVDDQPDQRAVICNLLEPLGFVIEQCSSGEEALQRVRQSPPDALLIDLVMPGMGGLDVIRHLRQMENWQRPIIVISANVFDRDREQASSAGCNGFLFKPVHLTDMLEQLQLHLSLQWIHAGESREDNPDPQEMRATPPPNSLIALREHARIGYIKGVTGEIERISALDPAYRSFAEQLRQLAREFRTADIVNLVEETLRNEPDRARA